MRSAALPRRATIAPPPAPAAVAAETVLARFPFLPRASHWRVEGRKATAPTEDPSSNWNHRLTRAEPRSGCGVTDSALGTLGSAARAKTAASWMRARAAAGSSLWVLALRLLRHHPPLCLDAPPGAGWPPPLPDWVLTRAAPLAALLAAAVAGARACLESFVASALACFLYDVGGGSGVSALPRLRARSAMVNSPAALPTSSPRPPNALRVSHMEKAALPPTEAAEAASVSW
mmetsp:Transcript_12559/g.48235  ORF Transcript_12559/g.48235 Transcript_12559/m.48235 type:complete len:232 (-) Transcript_12559:1100-1795(-)